MQQNLINEEQITELSKVSFLVGELDNLCESISMPALTPFEDSILEFLNALSKNLMSNRAAKAYPDIVTFGFWIRKSSMLNLKKRFYKEDENIHVGRGVAFHIAPSNVPVNYAYSLIVGLVTGNINIVRVPSKDFPQVNIINSAIKTTLEEFPEMSKYIYLLRYDRNKKINDVFSAISDVRIIWGGDNTIAELRKSPLKPRGGEITFADRYSLAIINSDYYLALKNKERLAEEFYNDTFLTDQNACTSPRIVVWTGSKKDEAKDIFWSNLHELVKEKYTFQNIMGVNKITSSYIFAALHEGTKVVPHEDNLIVRVKVDNPNSGIMDFRDNSGYFFEYDCNEPMELVALCDNTHCQTIGYLGNKEDILSLITSGVRGIDRVVPIGKTMDFDMIWDGYNLYERLTRIIKLEIK